MNFLHAESTPENASRLQEAIRRFDEANAADPNLDSDGTNLCPRELRYAKRLSEWVLRLRPHASEALRLAARCQHIRRWEVPRSSFPMTREGYLGWRESLKKRHAEIAGSILSDVGYPPEVIARVQSLNLKKQMKSDDECQTLEDALCLVFVQYQLEELANRTAEEKLISALQKSWAKMSSQAHRAALEIQLSERASALLEKALGTNS